VTSFNACTYVKLNTSPQKEQTMKIKVAVAQMDPLLGQPAENLTRLHDMLREAAGEGAQLVVFPECATTGYGFSDLDSAYAVADPIPGPTTEKLSGMCREFLQPGGGPYVVAGLLERGNNTRTVYNGAVLVGPDGLIGTYRKAHLPFLGVDRFTTPGDTAFHVWDTPLGRIGLLICYDLRFPEAMRALALEHADIIALPTNWPDGSQNAPEFVTRTRALENRVFVMACNRCGEESGFWFFGRSQISDPAGQVLVELGAQPGIGYATFDPGIAHEKRVVLRPGEFELDTIGDRRPELYLRLVKPD
jgi:predicted amidohydrolase